MLGRVDSLSDESTHTPEVDFQEILFETREEAELGENVHTEVNEGQVKLTTRKCMRKSRSRRSKSTRSVAKDKGKQGPAAKWAVGMREG